MCEVRELRVPEFCRDLAYRQRSVEKSQNCSLPQERLTQFAKGGPLFAEAPRLPPAAIEMLASDCGDAATLPFALGALRDIVLSREADDEAGAGRAALDAERYLAAKE